MTDLSLEVLARFGVNAYTPLKVVSAVLNGSETKLNREDPFTGKKVPDPQATKAAWDRRRIVSSAFEKWVGLIRIGRMSFAESTTTDITVWPPGRMTAHTSHSPA